MEYSMNQLLQMAVERGASDLHITVAVPPMLRISGALKPIAECDVVTNERASILIRSLLDDNHAATFVEKGEADFAHVLEGVGRFRVNVYRQKRNFTAAIRVISDKIPTMEKLGLPEVLKGIALKHRGLVLVTGPTGSGKTTTLAAMINYINETRNSHILTIEDPVEFQHPHKKSMVNQREVNDDTQSFANALRAALREDPDVILVGEMRDPETISTALTAAETGHLVFSTLHTMSSIQTVERIIDAYPPHQQSNVRTQLSSVMQAIVSQQLIPNMDGSGRSLAMELLVATDAVRNIIREGKNQQLTSSLQTGAKEGMVSLDASLAKLFNSGKISYDEALSNSTDPEMFRQYANRF